MTLKRKKNMNSIKLTENEEKGLAMLAGEATADGAVYWDDATRSYWLADWEDVAKRINYPKTADGYSRWCSDTTSQQLGSMTPAEATEWVKNHSDSDDLCDDELEAAFQAIFARKPDDQDWEQGLWSHLCAAVK
jgi:hypothetical protein